jgi:hypothetical protein
MSYEGQDDLISLSLDRKPSREPALGESNDDRTPEEKQRRTLASGMVIFGYLAAVMAVATGIVTTLAFHAIHDRLTQWPRVQASIDSCENYHIQVDHGGDSGSSFEYGFRCRITYTPRSLVYHSLVDIGYRSSNPNEMAAWAKSIHRGNSVPIIYDPSDFTRVHFVNDFRTSYAGAVHNLHFVIWTTLVSIAFIAFGSLLRPAVSS